eukprot:Skav216116  [mRNA]  locus=scaffold1946:161393:162542:+ [translate_table: standard]
MMFGHRSSSQVAAGAAGSVEIGHGNILWVPQANGFAKYMALADMGGCQGKNSALGGPGRSRHRDYIALQSSSEGRYRGGGEAAGEAAASWAVPEDT